MSIESTSSSEVFVRVHPVRASSASLLFSDIRHLRVIDNCIITYYSRPVAGPSVAGSKGWYLCSVSDVLVLCFSSN